MRVRILISGRVQGVFFRQFTVDNARQLGVKGWVKNTEDGKVEIVAEAEPNVMVKFIANLKSGPEASEVDDIQIEEEKSKGELKGFERR